MKKRKKKSITDIVLDSVIYLTLIALVLVTLYPLWYVVVASFSTSSGIASVDGLMFWPVDFATEGYRLVFTNRGLMNGLGNSFKVLFGALPINLVLTLLCGYFLACSGMFWKRLISFYILFTMYFGGGLIPVYLNIKSLGLHNTLWALIIPGALSVTNAIICKSAIEAVPASLTEAAYLDGANDFQILWKVIVPLIKPTLAVLALYYGVNHWNSWYAASIYITEEAKLPVQNIIRNILMADNTTLTGTGEMEDSYNKIAESIKYAGIVVSTAPILCVYPFLQKYFTKGVMIGAVKG